jgi:hypothetical protein
VATLVGQHGIDHILRLVATARGRHGSDNVHDISRIVR